jgi:hypothetical protein
MTGGSTLGVPVGLLAAIALSVAAYQAEVVFAPLTLGLFIIALVWPLQDRLQKLDPRSRRARDHDHSDDRRNSCVRVARRLGFHASWTFGGRRLCALPGDLRRRGRLCGSQNFSAGGCRKRRSRLAGDELAIDSLRREQANRSVPGRGQRVDMEMGRLVRAGHHRRGRREQPELAAPADPVDMAVAAHDHDARCAGLQEAQEPGAVDERDSDPLGERPRARDTR